MSPSVCVIIAAWNSSGTVGRAVASALGAPEVAEVIVVDDASEDATAAAAEQADDGSGRLRLIRLPENRGPAAARNAAIEASRSPHVAMLDADDMFLPGRFGPLLAQDGWDMIADNVLFVGDPETLPPSASREPPSFTRIDAADFARGNLTLRNRTRGEMGFLKPVLSRGFLDRHGLRYDENLRLGEDYDLYMRMLLAGARFLLTRRPGYGAVVRHNSLSARHRPQDLAGFLDATRRHGRHPRIDARTRQALASHARQTRARWLLRAFLDIKARSGPAAALRFALSPPAQFAPIAAGIARDKWRTMRGDGPAETLPRMLLDQ